MLVPAFLLPDSILATYFSGPEVDFWVLFKTAYSDIL